MAAPLPTADSHAALPTFADAKCWHCRSCRSRPAVSYAKPLATILRKALYILLTSLIIISCTSDNNIDGTWIGIYSGHPFTKQPIIIDPLIIEFKNGLYFTSGLFTKEESGNYETNSKTLKLDNGEELTFANKHTADSLTFKGTEQDTFPRILRKVSDSLRRTNDSEIKLIGKEFRFTINNRVDTIRFINDSLLSFSNPKNNSYYKRLFFNSFDMILISDYNAPPMFIREKVNKNIKVTIFVKEPIDLILSEL